MARGDGRRLLAVLGCAALVAALAPPAASSPVAPRPALIRVDQHGYLPRETKRGPLMDRPAVDHATFTVADSDGRMVLHGRVPRRSTGSWNSQFHAVYRLA